VIKFLDQSHVAKDPGIALMVNRSAVGKFHHKANRPAAWFATVHRWNNMHLHVTKGDMVAHIDGFDEFARKFPFVERLRHVNADDFSLTHLRQLDRIAQMISMRMGDQDKIRVIVSQVLERGWRPWILRQEWVDQDVCAPG